MTPAIQRALRLISNPSAPRGSRPASDQPEVTAASEAAGRALGTEDASSVFGVGAAKPDRPIEHLELLGEPRGGCVGEHGPREPPRPSQPIVLVHLQRD